jgi:multiple sugar transport system permease protein
MIGEVRKAAPEREEERARSRPAIAPAPKRRERPKAVMQETIVSKRTPLARIVTVVVLAIWIVWTLAPLLITALGSIKTTREAFATPAYGDWKGIASIFKFSPTAIHFERLFSEQGFGAYIWHGLVAAVGSAAIAVIMGTLGAYGLSRGRFKREKDISFWIISTRMAPAVVVIVPLYYIFRSFGMLSTLPGLIIAYTTFNLSFSIWLIKGFFDDLPVEIEEAAFVDGDSHWAVFRKIAVPLAAPGIVASFVLCVLFSWNDFLFAAVIGGHRAKTVPVGITELRTTVEVLWGPINSATIILIIPMIALGMLIRKYLIQGLTMGAVRE